MESIIKKIEEKIVSLGGSVTAPVQLTIQTSPLLGDYSTSIALAYAKGFGMKPIELAQVFVGEIADLPCVQKVEVAGPGFINIWLTKEEIRNRQKSATVTTKYTGKKVLAEHSSPNLFKPFHIGHLMNNIVGEFVVRSMKVSQAELITLSFPSDISLGIAKAVYIVAKDGGLSQPVFSSGQKEIINYLGSAYVRGTQFFEEHPQEMDTLKSIAQILYTETPSEYLNIYTHTKAINIEYFIGVTESLGSHFDALIYESESGVKGSEIVKSHVGDVFTESEGAIVYIPDESRKDINTSVFINSQGNPTYDAKDVGLLALKFERYHPDFSFTITDNEQTPHFKVVFDAVSRFEPVWTEKSIHVPHGRMTFKGQKMSSRLGGVPLAEDVIGAVLEEVEARSSEKIGHLSDSEKNELQRNIALSALRVAILRSKPGSNINFDPETSLSFEGDSGPYLLYTHARCASLIDRGLEMSTSPVCDTSKDVHVLERKVFHFESVLRTAIEEVAPQKLIVYLFELAQEFNTYYGAEKILVDGDIGNAHRLYLVEEVRRVLQQGLFVLGISAPRRM
jgi:arginyl-tRNA synthetase